MTESAGLVFRRARACSTEACVEVAPRPDSGGMVVRDSKDPHGPSLVYSDEQWRLLISSVALGGWPDAFFAWDDDHEQCSMTVPGDKTVLRFTAVEMEAFEKGVHGGEFALAPFPGPRSAPEDDPAYQVAGRS